MEIIILGPGCPNCDRMERVARQAVEETGVEANISHLTKMADIMAYPIVGTPGLVIDGEVIVSGRVPRKQEVVAWLQERA
jgi:small redox-active disulfide protein 2